MGDSILTWEQTLCDEPEPTGHPTQNAARTPGYFLMHWPVINPELDHRRGGRRDMIPWVAAS